jgi:ABC-type glycerol-3-phosphate transport system permease component
MPGGRDSRSAAVGPAAWITLALVALVVVVYGGYGHHWSWTGINGHTATLWDWLHLLLLPFAAVLLPLWLRHGSRMGPALKIVLAAVAGAFVVIVVAGYTIPWAWTGFEGNSLWDWLNLAALPLAVVLIPVFIELRGRWGRSHATAAGAGAATFLVLVIAGYTIPWAWTGFTGNTLWDWLHLLLLPLLVPVLLVPILTPRAMAHMGIVSDEEESEPAAEPAPDAEHAPDAEPAPDPSHVSQK